MHVQKCEGIRPNEDKSGEGMGLVFFGQFYADIYGRTPRCYYIILYLLN